MKKIVIMGHIDHGKTTLLHALSYSVAQDTEKRYEEGDSVTVNVGGEEYLLFDYADDDEYAAKLGSDVDGAVLVVSCADGPLHGTEFALDLCRDKGIQPLAVFMSYFDFVDDEDLTELMEFDICDLIDEKGFDSSDIFFAKGNADGAWGWGSERWSGPVIELFDAVVEKLS